MKVWTRNAYKGYQRAESASNDAADNSTIYLFDRNKQFGARGKLKVEDTRFSSDNGPESGQSTVKKVDNTLHYRIPLNKSDTLQSVAMKYGCSVWELKRANRLWGLQEIHALNSILVPASVNSYRAELLSKAGVLVPKHDGLFLENEEVDEEADASSGATGGDLSQASSSVAAASSSAGPVRQLSLRQAMSNESLGDCDSFLRTLDADLEQIKASTCFLKDSLDEVTQYLTVPTVLPPRSPSNGWLAKLKITGADCGLTWRGAVGIMILCCLLVPLLLYVLLTRRAV